MLYAGQRFPDWKLVEPEKKFIRIQNWCFQGANFSSVQDCSLGCPMPEGTVSQKYLLQTSVAPTLAILPLKHDHMQSSCGAFWNPPWWYSLSLLTDAPSHQTTNRCLLRNLQPTGPVIFPNFIPAKRCLCWGPLATCDSAWLNPTLCLTDSPQRGNAALAPVSQQGWGASVLGGFQGIGLVMPQLTWPKRPPARLW